MLIKNILSYSEDYSFLGGCYCFRACKICLRIINYVNNKELHYVKLNVSNKTRCRSFTAMNKNICNAFLLH